MASLFEITNRMVEWFAANPTNPPIRDYALATGAQPRAYPALAVLPQRVRFAPNGECAQASVTLRLACQAGRSVDALAQALALAEQLQRSIIVSHNLGGLARAASVEGLHWPARDRGATLHSGGAPFFEFAEVELSLRFNT
jgi:hypothetical protein